jgi:hypothetical protein
MGYVLTILKPSCMVMSKVRLNQSPWRVMSSVLRRTDSAASRRTSSPSTLKTMFEAKGIIDAELKYISIPSIYETYIQICLYVDSTKFKLRRMRQYRERATQRPTGWGGDGVRVGNAVRSKNRDGTETKTSLTHPSKKEHAKLPLPVYVERRKESPLAHVS